MNSRERIFAMLEGTAVDHLPAMPITMMFAADQVGAKYLEYATDYHVQVEGQIRVAERFGVDHVSVISDPCCEAADLGAAIKFFPDQPPAIDEENALLKDKTVLAKLKPPDPLGGGRMTNRVQAVGLLKERAGGEKAIEGWIEGPCGESADLRGINRLMVDFYDDPGFVGDLMDFVVEMELGFAKAQIDAGVEIMGIGDPASSLVGPRFYEDIVFARQKKMIDGIHAMGARARLHICGNTRHMWEGLGRVGCDILDQDSLHTLGDARSKIGPRQVLLGNIDPVQGLRNGTPESVYEAVGECHRQAGDHYIVGAGCEVVRDTAEENFHAMMRYARGHRPESS
ncbi:MAG TPA: uroporphyrinogen decarboxylase family protein [Terriglobia bacterium]|nr:uroporphyrinogen decarboxylase family protein [Terriglobia bacterium]